MTDTTIARTILEQLGGSRFVMMTGARQLTALEHGLMFGLPRYPGVKANKVRVILDPSDTYTVETYAIHGLNVRKLSTDEGIYDDGLAQVFRLRTGLETRL